MSRALAIDPSTLTTANVVAANVRAEAARKGFSQIDLARSLGMGQGAVTTRWKGQRPWQLDELDRVAAVLGMSVIELVTPPPGYAEWVAKMNNSPAGGSHQSGSKARSKGLEPPTF